MSGGEEAAMSHAGGQAYAHFKSLISYTPTCYEKFLPSASFLLQLEENFSDVLLTYINCV